MNAGVVGLGEVGKAVRQLLETKYQVFARDLNFDELADQKIEYLHICVPYSDKFGQIVADLVNEFKPQLIVIHSTLKPGTTEDIQKKTKADIVHSPFLGVHPTKPKGQFIHGEGKYLYDYFANFPKVIGPTTKKSGKLAKKHFESVGLKVALFDSAKDSELAKILSTTYYGWNIIFEKWVYKTCTEFGANFNQVYSDFNRYYNEGYKDTLPHVIRPNLKHHTGEIGGHCVISNAEIVHDWLADEFTQFLLTQNKKLAKI